MAPLSEKTTPPCSKLAGKLPVLKRGCLPQEHNKGRSGCWAGTATEGTSAGQITCKMKAMRMLVAWVQTLLISNMLLAEAYASGGKVTTSPFCSNSVRRGGEWPPISQASQMSGKDAFSWCVPRKLPPLSPLLPFLARGLCSSILAIKNKGQGATFSFPSLACGSGGDGTEGVLSPRTPRVLFFSEALQGMVLARAQPSLPGLSG